MKNVIILSNMRLVVIRHGKTDGNAKSILQGQRLDESLNAEGVSEVLSILPGLAQENIIALYSSPLRRAHETAQLIAKKLGLPIVLRNELVERDFGTLSGLTWEEIAKLGHTALHQADKSLCYDYRQFGGENVDQVRHRVCQFLNDLIGTHKEETVACVTHSGIIRLFYNQLHLEQPPHTANTLHTFKLTTNILRPSR